MSEIRPDILAIRLFRIPGSMAHNGCMPNSGRIFPFVVACILAAAPFGYSQASAAPLQPDTPRPRRPVPPTRDPHTPGYVKATELPDGAVPAPNENGNFIIGPTHTPAPELADPNRPLDGTVVEFTMRLPDSKYYPGIARNPGSYGTPDPDDPAQLIGPQDIPHPTHARSRCMCRRAMRPGLKRRLSWARMGRTACCLPRWTH